MNYNKDTSKNLYLTFLIIPVIPSRQCLCNSPASNLHHPYPKPHACRSNPVFHKSHRVSVSLSEYNHVFLSFSDIPGCRPHRLYRLRCKHGHNESVCIYPYHLLQWLLLLPGLSNGFVPAECTNHFENLQQVFSCQFIRHKKFPCLIYIFVLKISTITSELFALLTPIIIPSLSDILILRCSDGEHNRKLIGNISISFT